MRTPVPRTWMYLSRSDAPENNVITGLPVRPLRKICAAVKLSAPGLYTFRWYSRVLSRRSLSSTRPRANVVRTVEPPFLSAAGAVKPVENTRRADVSRGIDAVGAGTLATFPVVASRQPVSGTRRRRAAARITEGTGDCRVRFRPPYQLV